MVALSAVTACDVLKLGGHRDRELLHLEIERLGLGWIALSNDLSTKITLHTRSSDQCAVVVGALCRKLQRCCRQGIRPAKKTTPTLT